MPEFSDAFRSYLPPDEARIRQAITTGLIVLDTNVLLDAYRYTKNAREELFATLRTLSDRLWIPHQVALEFHRRRIDVIASHGDSYTTILKALAEFKRTYDEELNAQIREFSNRVSLSNSERDDLLEPLKAGIEALHHKINQLGDRHGVSDRFISDDPVLRQIQALVGDRTGEPFSPEDQEVALAEANRRIKEQIPPGFKDAGKADSSGDYLLWLQSLQEAKRRGLPFILVTRDNKDDWFLRVKGRTVGALPKLVAEAESIAGVDFIALQTKTFLIHAKNILKTEISDTTISQAGSIKAQHGTKQPRPILRVTGANYKLIIETLEHGIALLIRRTDEITNELRQPDLTPIEIQKLQEDRERWASELRQDQLLLNSFFDAIGDGPNHYFVTVRKHQIHRLSAIVKLLTAKRPSVEKLSDILTPLEEEPRL